MKHLFRFVTIIFFIAASFKLAAQENGSFTFQILDYKGSPIQKARLIVLSGESHFASSEGLITYLGEEDYVKKNGVMVKTRVMPHYIKAKAPGYKDRTIDLTQYALGAYIVVKLEKLEKMSSDYKSIDVYVKDKNGKPVSGASVSVNPGKATTTDANGFAKAMHTILLSGEYVAIEVYKEGYKIQKQFIPSGDAPRMENGRQIPPATAYFTLEKGDNNATIFHINVEVLDFETDEPVPGASVQLEVSDGTIMKGITNAKGEYRFSDVEYSFAGTTSKVIVKKTGYEEKWSDITSELMTGNDNPERQFLVNIRRKGGLPKVINECEGGICGKFTMIAGNQYQAVWNNGAKATMTLEQFGDGKIVITRGDTQGSVTNSMTARYTGTITGNEVKDGKVTWTWNGSTWSGTWTANW